MAKVRQDFSTWLLSVQSSEYLGLVKSLRKMEGVIDARQLQKVADAVKGEAYASFATTYYQTIWNTRSYE